MRKQTDKYVSRDEALKKLQRYCAYQDRCHQEVRRKLLDLGIFGDTLEEIMVELVADNFLNEERFARSYARGKFRIKQWGRIRIRQELQRRAISDYCIRKAMEEIRETDYRSTLREVLEKRMRDKPKIEGRFERSTDLVRHGMNRGYELPIIKEEVGRLMDETFGAG